MLLASAPPFSDGGGGGGGGGGDETLIYFWILAGQPVTRLLVYSFAPTQKKTHLAGNVPIVLT